MKPLYTQLEFDSAKTNEKLPCQCYTCNKTFFKEKRVIQRVLRKQGKHSGKYCSAKCHLTKFTYKEVVNCKQCDKNFEKLTAQIKQFPNHFCSRSCAATYNNIHKTHGTRRSKLEVWLEEQLTILYPNLQIDFNKKDAINSELDIYIPSLKLAFELNGIFHYEPIYGEDKLDKIKNNDQRKFSSCAEKEISLCIIDSSKLSYFKPKNTQKYLDIIIKIIDDNIDSPSELESESKD